MGVTAQKIDNWYLSSFDAKTVLRTVDRPVLINGRQEYENKTYKDPESGESETVKVPKIRSFVEKRIHWTISITRKVIGVTAFIDESGQERNSYSFLTGPETTMFYASTSKKFICTSDVIVSAEKKVGECEETQVWEYASPWKTITT